MREGDVVRFFLASSASVLLACCVGGSDGGEGRGCMSDEAGRKAICLQGLGHAVFLYLLFIAVDKRALAHDSKLLTTNFL